MLRLAHLLFTLVTLLAPPVVYGQGEEWVLEGTVTNSVGAPVESAVVEAAPGGALVATTASGSFRLVYQGDAVTHINVSHLSYATVSVALDTIDDPGRIRINLARALYDLEAVEVQDRPDALSTLVKSSQHVHVVTEEYLARRQAGTFAGALADLPGVSAMQLGVGIAKPVIRGMSFNRIIVNNRGIKQEGQQWGADHGLEVDPFDVSTVEVIKGPASLLYGSDGLGGVININPHTFDTEDGDRVRLTTSYQTNNRAIANSAEWKGRKREWTYRARVTQQDYGDYSVPTQRFTYAGFELPIYGNRLKNTAGRELHYSVMVGRERKRHKSTLRFSAFNQTAGIFTGAIGIPRSYNLRHAGRHRDIDFPRQRNQHLMLTNNHRFTFGKSSVEVDLGAQWNKRKELSFPGAHGIAAAAVDSDLALGLDLTTYTVNARYKVAVREGYDVLFGVQAQRGDNRRSGFEFLLPDYRSTQLGLFNYHEWNHKDRWIVNAGLRYDRGRHDVRRHLQATYDPGTLLPTGAVTERSPALDRTFENLSGAAGASYLLDARNNIKLNLGNSFRLPTVIELASNGVHHGNFRHERGDANLDIERGYQVDLTYLHTGPRWRLELSAFYALYQRYIYLSPSGRFSDLAAGGSLWEYRQDDAVFNGLEVMVTYQPRDDLEATVTGEFVQNLNLDSGLPLPLTPAPSLHTDVEYRPFARSSGRFTDAYLSVSTRALLAQRRVDRNERTTPGTFLLDFALGTRIAIAGRELQCSVRVDNALDVAYFNHISRYRLINLPEQGRNVVVSINVPITEKN